MSHRFVVGPDLALDAEQCRQIAQVLRLRPGDVVTLVHGGEELAYRLDHVAAAAVGGTVVARERVTREAALELTLAIPLLRGEHTELIVESATQLGVARFVPYVSERSVVRDLAEAKRGRLLRIAREATETSRRAQVPALGALVGWADLFGVLPAPVLVAWEEEPDRSLRSMLAAAAGAPRALSIVIGPEGGLGAGEIALARSQGAITVSLGVRTLRAETAAIAAVAVALAE